MSLERQGEMRGRYKEMCLSVSDVGIMCRYISLMNRDRWHTSTETCGTRHVVCVR